MLGLYLETAAEKNVGMARRKILVLGLILPPILSCSQDDRLVTITCDNLAESPIPVETAYSINKQHTSLTGYLNSQGLSLGSIVQIAPSTAHAGVLTLKGPQLSSPIDDALVSYPILLALNVGNGFQAHMDDDIRMASHNAHHDLDSEIVKHTMLYVENPTVRYLAKIGPLLDRHPDIANSIRTATQQTAIVSEVIEGDRLVLFSDVEGIAINTGEIANSYVHVTYSCQTVRDLDHEAHRVDRATPLIIYLTPLTYDAKTSSITVGKPGSDL